MLVWALALLSANLKLEGPISDKVSFFVAARRSYTDIIKSGLYDKIFELTSPIETNQNQRPGGVPPGGSFPGGGRGRQIFTQETPDFYFYDLNAKVSYMPTEKDVLSLSFYNGRDNLDNSINNNAALQNNALISFSNETTDLTDWGNWGLSGKWARQWNDRWYSNVVLAYSNYYSERERLTRIRVERDTLVRDNQQGLTEDNDVKDITLRWDNELKLGTANQLGFGAQITNQNIQYNYTANDTITVLDRHDKGNTYAVYLQDKLKLFNRLSLTLGGRATYYDVNQQIYIEPRAS